MIVTVTPNPAIDLTIDAAGIEWGETNRIPDALWRAGGKGLNVARVLTGRGVPVVAIAAVGTDDVTRLRDDLADVSCELIATDRPTRRTYALVHEDGSVTMLTERGPGMERRTLTQLRERVAARMSRVRALVISGSAPAGFGDDDVAELVRLANANGVPSLVDMSGSHLLAAARAGTTIVKPNRRELSDTLGYDRPLAGARELQRMGANFVVVSLGEHGLLVVPPGDTSKPVRAKAAVRRGNPTGAGDAAVASLAAHLAERTSDPRALARRAAAWSASAVAAVQAGDVSHDLDETGEIRVWDEREDVAL